MFEKNTARRIENSLLDLAGMFAWRAAVTHSAPASLASFLGGVRFHRSFAFHRSSLNAIRALSALDLGWALTKVNRTEQFRFEDVKARGRRRSSGHGEQESGPRPANVQGRARVRGRLGQGLTAALRGFSEPQTGHYVLARSATRDAARG